MRYQQMLRLAGGWLAVLAIVSSADAQMSTPTGRETLRGLTGVEVVVEPIDAEVERAGLSQAVIQSDVEGQLKEKGIRVYATQNENPSPAKAYVYVHLNALKLPHAGGYAMAIQVQLRQTLRSLVTNSQVVNAMTWDAHNVVFASTRQFRAVRDEIASYVERFARDWLATH